MVVGSGENDLWERIGHVVTWQEAESLYRRKKGELSAEQREELFGIWERLLSVALSKAQNVGEVRRLRKNAPPNSRVRRSTEIILEAMDTRKRICSR